MTTMIRDRAAKSIVSRSGLSPVRLVAVRSARCCTVALNALGVACERDERSSVGLLQRLSLSRLRAASEETDECLSKSIYLGRKE